MGKAARSKCLAMFDYRRMVAEIEEVYERAK
jgi:hypothetical protein